MIVDGKGKMFEDRRKENKPVKAGRRAEDKLAKKEETKKNKGITLIALVITIIVMLILVAVTITMAINGGLFGYAGNAAKQTEGAKQEELEYTNITATDWTYENLIDKYAAKEIITFYIKDDNEITTSYQAEKGMTWEKWVESTYNKVGSRLHYNDVMFGALSVQLQGTPVIKSDVIEETTYILGR